jgi:uncharacterized protein with HEPN domain
MERDQVLVNHILGSIESVESYTAGLTKEEFLGNFMVQDAVARNIEILGEACSKISQETKEEFPKIPWRDIVAMRNILIHEYFRSDPETVWNVVQIDIPELKKLMIEILNSETE